MEAETKNKKTDIWHREFCPWMRNRKLWIRMYYGVLFLDLVFLAGMQLFVFVRGWPMQAASAFGLPVPIVIVIAILGAGSLALSAWLTIKMPAIVGYRQSASLALMSSVQASFLIVLFCIPVAHTKVDPGLLFGWKLMAFLNVVGLVLAVVTVVGHIRGAKVKNET